MYKIGITGGVGSGKSEVMHFLQNTYDCEVILSDDLARELMWSGSGCFDRIVQQFGTEILGADGEFDRKKLADRVFADEKELKRLNQIVHPAVKEAIKERMKTAQSAGKKLFFLESALLIEENYNEICDELWYVYADECVRFQRLKESRGYSDEKTRSIIENQLPEEVFRKCCRFTIDNSGSFQETKKQIQARMEDIIS
jgi:dephospho-CoA kinase